MGAPAVAVAALAKTRTGRKVMGVVLLLIILANAAFIVPIIAVPMAIAGQSATEAIAGPDGTPEVKVNGAIPSLATTTRAAASDTTP